MRISFLLVVFFIAFGSCKESSENLNSENFAIPKERIFLIKNVEVKKSDLVLNPLEGVWYYNDEPYNGYSLKFHKNNTPEEKLGFYNGKREGVAKTWSANGVLRITSNYSQNKLVGDYKSYWENGNVALQVNYIEGKKEGEEKQFYSNGEISKLRWLENGKENGLQKAWLPNGKLYVNYEAKNGRVFGLMRANACYKLENEKVVKKK
ncbi:toxin-antitoxin system YwqK family antitoxin [Winogradskyella wichelsiae]|uniref:toxin-antitoxin system YwqK family antitoxin n=1 Tax=Winogradskyella wichelsiae TaxID=2697007 RepID=UPI0015C70B02|nr:hypothetical protein [Winogradskyella wichelsiae]